LSIQQKQAFGSKAKKGINKIHPFEEIKEENEIDNGQKLTKFEETASKI